MPAHNARRTSFHRLSICGLIVALVGAVCAHVPLPAVASAPAETEPLPVEALRPGAPASHTVEKGDTLWDISARFLRDPWRWPEIWRNNPQIANPHLIYPGDVVSILWADGRPVIRLLPRVRVEPLTREAQAIPATAISPFLIKPLVVGAEELADAPYIVGSHERRLIYGTNDTVYVAGVGADGGSYLVYRPGRPLHDPATGELLGHQTIQIAEAEVVRSGDPAELLIVRATREVLSGDRLLAAGYEGEEEDYYPGPPDRPVEGTVVAIFDALSQVARSQTVAVNRGHRDGLRRGDLLAVHRAGRELRDRHAAGGVRSVTLPDERVGLLMVFRVYEKMSYAVIMESERPVREGDRISNP